MLDPCTWGLLHLSLRVAELGVPGKLGAPGLQSEANFLTCLNKLSFLMRSWKSVFWQFLACDLLCGLDGVS